MCCIIFFVVSDCVSIEATSSLFAVGSMQLMTPKPQVKSYSLTSLLAALFLKSKINNLRPSALNAIPEGSSIWSERS